jgi:hypothetical protein
MIRRTLFAAALLSATAAVALAGEWHSGTTNVCTDCHTMHFSMQHNWDGTSPVSTTGQPNGNWLSATGPNNYLLKAPANQLCLSCHDGQSFAPDVFGLNANAAPTQGRSAGAINDPALGAPYDTYKGHTLDSTATPPGWDPAAVGLSATWYNPAGGLECISCHAQHGPTDAYRNLGAYALGGSASNFRPTYTIATATSAMAGPCRNASGARNSNCDVLIQIDPTTYSANSGSAATFNPFYDNANTKYNKITYAAIGTTNYSNRIDAFCASCHGDFHGGPADATISNGQTVAGLDGFIRHPTSVIVIGASGAAGYGGHSALARYTGATTKVKVLANDQATFTDASPTCISCHKSHGNQNPFGLIFLNRAATAIGEEGGYATGQVEMANGYGQGYRNLCGQCHGQGN